jgi:hypothetical protein
MAALARAGITGRPPLVVKDGGGVVTAGGGEDDRLSGGGATELLEDVVFPAGPLEDENPAGSGAGGLEEVTLAGTVKPDPGKLLVEGAGSVDSVGEDSDEEDVSTGFAATSFCPIVRTAIVPATPTPTSKSTAIPPPIANHAPVDKPPAERAWLGS